jgi:hypothetical protein
MPSYRLYFVGEDGRYSDVVAFECADDEAALALAETHCAKRRHLYGMQLWQEARKVQSFPSRSEAPARQRRR